VAAEFSPKYHPKMLTITQQNYHWLGSTLDQLIHEGKLLVHANCDQWTRSVVTQSSGLQFYLNWHSDEGRWYIGPFMVLYSYFTIQAFSFSELRRLVEK